MLKTFGSHVRGNVVGYIALFIALGGTTYAATGDNFILGKPNSASTPTQLSSGTAGSALKVTNTASGWAFQAAGNATQGRGRGGLVKAMALVDPFIPSDPIRQCFNSQVEVPSKATTGNCGITYAKPGTGQYYLNFGFQVDDRFVAGTARGLRILSVFPQLTPGLLLVQAESPANHNFSDTSFYILVY